MIFDDYISVRDWRRRPPMRLRVTRKLHICWCWIKCTRCPHMRAVAITPYIIRWGPDEWQQMLRQTARCTECGKRGVALQHPSWGGTDTGWAPMPINKMAPVPSRTVEIDQCPGAKPGISDLIANTSGGDSIAADSHEKRFS